MPHQSRSMSEKEREGKPESIISLEEPSLAMTTCLKIKVKCVLQRLLTLSTYRRHLELSKEGHRCLLLTIPY
jgi:hypothetical protein